MSLITRLLAVAVVLASAYSAPRAQILLQGAGASGKARVAPASNDLLLVDGVSYLLLVDGVSKLCLVSGC